MSENGKACQKCGTTEMEGKDHEKDSWSHCARCCARVHIGDFPFCKGNKTDHGPMYGFDEAFEPYVDCQLLPQKDPRCNSKDELGRVGVMINSRSERRRIMKEQELQYGTQKFEDRGKKFYFT